MPNGSSLTTSTTFSVESRRMVRRFLPRFHSHRPHNLPGTGAVYSFDPVGSYEREACRAAGAAQSLVQPFLDNQVSLFLSSFRFPFFPISSPSKFLPLPLRDMYIARFTELHPNLCRLPNFPSKTLTRCIPFVDILQEPGGGTRNDTPSTSITTRCVIHRDRFVHQCNRTPHRSELTPPFVPPTCLPAQPYLPL